MLWYDRIRNPRLPGVILSALIGSCCWMELSHWHEEWGRGPKVATGDWVWLMGFEISILPQDGPSINVSFCTNLFQQHHILVRASSSLSAT